MKINKNVLCIISIFGSYIISRILFKYINFKYEIFNEPFNLEKFIVDFGCWIVIFGIVQFFLLKIFGDKNIE